MLIPTVHLNGTSKSVLYGQIRSALDALRLALNAMTAAAPNGRDYYPQGEAAINQAGEEHRNRMLRVESVSDEYLEILSSLVDKYGF